MKYEDRKRTRRNTGMMRSMLCAAFLISHFSFLIDSAWAQSFVSEIKVVAVQDEDSIAKETSGYIGYSGTDDLDKDFRKGKGGGYVFVVHKFSNDTTDYITKVVVTADRKDSYGQNYNEDSLKFLAAPFFQAKSRNDEEYRGGLNGRNYLCYGGAYPKQPHIYYTHTGRTDFNQKVLQNIEVYTSKPENLASNQTYSGAHAGGERYLVYTWHIHEPQYKATGDVNWHIHYCDKDGCRVTKTEPHRFPQYYHNDLWMQFDSTETKYSTHHYKKCIDCGQIVDDKHKMATFVANWEEHTNHCLICDYVESADHKNFGKQKIPVDQNYHVIFCDDCGFIERLRHNFNEDRFVVKQDCEYSMVEYKCKQCAHKVYFEEEGVGHDYDAFGICTRKNCLHPYQQPEVEKIAGGDSVFVIKTFSNLYWVADYVNNRRPKANFRLASDLTADSLMKHPWRPIGLTDSTAFQGTFDGGGHVISMLQTEQPVAGTGYRGLFGVIGKNGTVKNVSIAGCKIRGWDYIGAVAGLNEGTIDGCQVVFTEITSISTGKNLGGICGLNKGTISNCTTESNVWVGGVLDYAGGICGTNASGTITGNVSAAICGNGSDAMLPEIASSSPELKDEDKEKKD